MPAKPTYDELAAAYIDLHTAAQIVADHFRSTPGGDAFRWTGNMNSVEMLRQELDLHETNEKFDELMYGNEAVRNL